MRLPFMMLLVCCVASPLAAATFTVTTSADAGGGTLRQAIIDANAQPGFHVVDARGLSGVIVLASQLPNITGHVTLKGPGKAVPMLSHAPAAPREGTMFHVAEGGTLALQGVNVTPQLPTEWYVAVSYAGASVELHDCHIERTLGVLCFGRLVTRDCVFARNPNFNGGAIRVEYSGELCCVRTRFEDNGMPTAGMMGGAVRLASGQGTFDDCVFLDNKAGYGGGAIFSSGRLVVRDCVFQTNTCIHLPSGSPWGGGAILLHLGDHGSNTVDCERCLFVGNETDSSGGAISIAGTMGPSPGSLKNYQNTVSRLVDCCFLENRAGYGGAVASYGSLKVWNCTFVGNDAGAIYHGDEFRELELASSTVRGNTSATGAGGVEVWIAGPLPFPALRVQNCVIAENTGPEGDFFSVYPLPPAASGGFNFIGVSATFPASATDVVGTAANPQIPLLSGLAQSGSRFPLLVPLPNSPVIDRGGPYYPLAADARGAIRPVNFPAIPEPPGGDSSDIGAVESQQAPKLVSNHSALEFVIEPGNATSRPARVFISGFALTQAITLTTSAPFELAVSEQGPYQPQLLTALPDVHGNVGSVALWMRYAPTLGNVHQGALSLVSTGAPTVQVALLGFILPAQPGTITLSQAGLTFSLNDWDQPGAAQSYTVAGVGLTRPIRIGAPAPFEISFNGVADWRGELVTVAPAAGVVPPTTVFVRYRPYHGNHCTCLAGHFSPGAPTVNVRLEGSMIPTFKLTVDKSELRFVTPAHDVATVPQSVTVTSLGLLDGTVTCDAPFQVSLSPTGGFTSALAMAGYLAQPTTLYVRYNPPPGGLTYRGGITHRGGLQILGHSTEYPNRNPRIVVELLGVVEPTPAPLPARIYFELAYHFSFPGGLYLEAPGLNLPQYKPYTLKGADLIAPIDISVPMPFALSFNQNGPWNQALQSPPPTAGVLAPVTIWVRFLPTTEYEIYAELAHTSAGALPNGLRVKGVVRPMPGIIQTSAQFSTIIFTPPGMAPPADESYTVSGTGLTQPIEIRAYGPSFSISLSPTGPFTTGGPLFSAPPVQGIASAVVHVRCIPQSTARSWGAVEHTSDGALLNSLGLRTVPVIPAAVSTSFQALDFVSRGPGQPSDAKTYVLASDGLSVPVTISVTPPFQISLAQGVGYGSRVLVLAQDANSVLELGPLTPTVIHVRYVPTSGAAHQGTITHTCGTMPPVVVNLTGAMVQPGPILASAPTLSFSSAAVATSSAPQSFDLSGANLAGPVAIGMDGSFEAAWSASGPWSPALMSPLPQGGVVGPLTVHVRYLPQTPGTHIGLARLSSPGATEASVALDGFVIVPPTIVAPAGGFNFVSPWAGTPSPEQNFVLSGHHLTGPVAVDVPPPFEVSLTPGVGFGSQVQTPAPAGGVVGPLTIYVRYTPLSGTAHADVLSATSPGAATVSASLAGSIVSPAPQLNVGSAAMSFSSPGVGVPSGEQSYIVDGIFVAAPVAITTLAPFEVSLSSGGGFGPAVNVLPVGSGVVPPTTVYVRYLPTTAGSHARSLNHDTVGANTISVTLSGSVMVVVPPLPSILVSAASLEFDAQAGGTSAEQSYDVSGSNLAGPIIVVVSGPFEISLTPGVGFGAALQLAPSAGAVPPTAVYVRHHGLLGTVMNGSINHSCVGVAPVTTLLSVRVQAPPTEEENAPDTACSATAGVSFWLPLGALAAAPLRRHRRTIHSAMLK